MTDSKNIDTVPTADAVMSETPNVSAEPDGPVGPSTSDLSKPLTADAGEVLGQPDAPAAAGRTPDGRFSFGNAGHFIHGARSRKPATDDPRATEMAAAMMNERGGADSLGIVTKLWIQEFCFLSVQLADVHAYLEAHGLQTVNGKIRQGSVNASLNLSARRERLAALLAGAMPTLADAGALDLTDVPEDELISRLQGFLDAARGARDAKVNTVTTPTMAATTTTSAPTITRTPEPEPEPEPHCQYCRRSTARCRELRADWLEKWRALHTDDPTEVERRRYASHLEMIESMRRARRGY